MEPFRNGIRQFNKHVFNRLIGRLAGARFSPISLVRHQGRKTGKVYETPVIVAPTPGGFVFALTYGPKVDWFRNVQASGTATLRRLGQEFKLDELQPMSAAAGRQAFGWPFSVILGLMDIQDFYQMRAKAQAS